MTLVHCTADSNCTVAGIYKGTRTCSVLPSTELPEITLVITSLSNQDVLLTMEAQNLAFEGTLSDNCATIEVASTNQDPDASPELILEGSLTIAGDSLKGMLVSSQDFIENSEVVCFYELVKQ